ncbi:Glycosyltransferase involved in cell wall bisynthesis [Sphingomonas sp. YR710]|uniref:glycosyltransferase family 4 protein n=1 Tax=Sphingomonas sp. YR710 TaxID=1882773 RepID=UPI000884B0A4|nr:glycosyltransferase family 4 protein [Sphingomonas sp. YR710]SDC77966.1 Glycosyltransferase involved in cell wall bisynthesis [Sphingomonas sp. YR710]
MRISILSPAPIHGSGGLRTIFTYASGLHEVGFDVEIVILDQVPGTRNLEAEAADFYGIRGIPIRYWPCDFSGSDMIVATRWDSARIARDSGARLKAYLVQDYESLFNAMGDSYIAGENGYLYGLSTITLGRWLNRTLATDFGNDAYRMDFGVDTSIYYPFERKTRAKPAICAILQPEKPRRCGALLIEALGIVAHNYPDVPIRLYGGEEVPLWYKAEQMGIITPPQLSELYNESTVGICMSSSNPSRVPFEMMACGLPVVDLYRSNNLLDLPEAGCLLAHQTPESVAEAIAILLVNTELANDLSRGGAELMHRRTLREETWGFVRAIQAIADGKPPQEDDIAASLYKRPAVIGRALRHSTVFRHCARQVELLALA